MSDGNEQTIKDLGSCRPEIDGIEIIDQLGKGGTSNVFRARQVGTDRIVALKVLSSEAVQGESSIKRFRQEARLTTKLDHPNIVKVLAFGISRDNQPYLVMEYIQGKSLAEDLKINGRMSLLRFRNVFLPVLSALEAAHEAGLVHRDVKPANIMLTLDIDGVERAKLLDFGIAKELPESGVEAVTLGLTHSGSLIGSPAYMSPEQCDGKPLDRRSDIYSMACVMYEALSGMPPFSASTSLEIMRKHLMQTPPTVAELCSTIDISQELAETIVWGLQKAPAERPQTASEYARKLDTVLGAITLDEIPETKSKSARPGYQRIVAVAAVLSILTGTALWFFSSQEKQMKEDMSTRIDLSAKKRTKKNMASQKEALLIEAVSRRQNARGPEDPSLLTPLGSLMDLYEAQERDVDQERILKRIVRILEKAGKRDEGDLAKRLEQLGQSYERQNRFAEGEAVCKRALKLKEEVFGLNNLEVTYTLVMLGTCCDHQQKYKEAERYLKRNLSIREKVLNSSDMDISYAAYFLAFFYQNSEKQYQIAQPLFEKALRVSLQNKEPKYLPHTASMYYGLGRNLRLLNRPTEALEPLRKSLALRLNLTDSEVSYDELLVTSLDLADTYSSLGKTIEALSLYQQALALAKKHNDLLSTAKCHFHLGEHYYATKLYAKAEKEHQQALSIREKLLGPNNLDVAESCFGLARCYQLQGRATETASLYERSLQIRTKILGTTHELVVSTRKSLADLPKNVANGKKLNN